MRTYRRVYTQKTEPADSQNLTPSSEAMWISSGSHRLRMMGLRIHIKFALVSHIASCCLLKSTHLFTIQWDSPRRIVSFIIVVFSCSFAISRIAPSAPSGPRSASALCLPACQYIHKNNLLQDSGSCAGESSRLLSDFVFVCVHVCECLRILRGKNRCCCSSRLGFLILATNTLVIYVIVLLLRPKRDWKRDEGTDGKATRRRESVDCKTVAWQEPDIFTWGPSCCCTIRHVCGIIRMFMQICTGLECSLWKPGTVS